MVRKRHILVIDATPFTGGSKVATENILRQIDDESIPITVLTADPKSWNWERLHTIRLFEPRWLAKQVHGLPYFIRHLFITLQLLYARYKKGAFDIALGVSGPGVDLSLYLAKPLLKFKIIQLIHGNVACSRTIGKCLLLADEVHYLESTKNSLLAAISLIFKTKTKQLPRHYQQMQNGIPASAWPQRCQIKRPVIFWAASLLKWKGLEVLLGALSILRADERNETHICFIRPKNTTLDVSEAPIEMRSVFWHEAPNNLDIFRSATNIFVSTSINEPFGLSILEAMAAGHCIVIPADGAYWDRNLKEGVECVKYQPFSITDLADKLFMLTHNMPIVRRLGDAAAKKAELYRAELCYANIKNSLVGNNDKQTTVLMTEKEPD